MINSLPVDYRVDMVLRQSPLVISPPVSLGNDTITGIYYRYLLQVSVYRTINAFGIISYLDVFIIFWVIHKRRKCY